MRMVVDVVLLVQAVNIAHHLDVESFQGRLAFKDTRLLLVVLRLVLIILVLIILVLIITVSYPKNDGIDGLVLVQDLEVLID